MSLTRIAVLGLALVACSSKTAGKPPPPTATDAAVLGVVVGVTPIAEARATVEARGHACEDASLAAMMTAAHAKHGVIVPEGAPPSAIPGMPAGHDKYFNDPEKSKALRQVRITCASVPLAALGDGRDAPAGQTARLLLVAPDAGAPVELIALQRTHTDGDQAAADARSTVAALERRFGAAAERLGQPPAPGERLARMSPVQRAWRFDGFAVQTTAVDLGPTGISVSEELTVR